MGTYVSKPVTDKESHDEEFKHLKCGTSSMQGWRTAQEDAHNAILNYDSVSSLFGVYDGHGGPEVAEFVAKYYPNHLLNSEEYKKGDFENALIKTFLDFDAKILEPANLKELKKIAALNNSEDGYSSSSSNEDLEEIIALRKEATMPIDEVIATNYSENSSHAKMLSPMIRPKKPAESTGTSSKSAIKMDLDNESEETVDSKDKQSDSESTKIDREANGVVPKVHEETTVNGSENTKSSSQSKELPKVTNGDKNTESEKSVKVNGDVKKNGEAPENSTNGDSDPSSAGYIGKGKSGGKGGKVKGKSVITTTKIETPEETKPVVSPSKPKRESAQEAKKVVLSAEDLDSEEDEEDETFAVDGMDDADDDDDDDEEDDDEENGADEAEDDEEEDDEFEEDSSDDDMYYGEEDTKICNQFHKTMRDEPGINSGCTACVALLHKHTLYVANVGDSRCVVSRSGKAIEMSLDHKPEDEIESKRINKAGGVVTSDGRVNGGLNLSRAFGDHGYKTNDDLSASEQMISPLPDIKSLNLAPTDEFVIIACDGIWNSMTSQEAVDFVNNYIKEDPNCKMSEICESMFEFCLAPDLDGDGTGCDNMTCIIFSFKDKSILQDLENDEATKTLLKLQSTNDQTSETQSNGCERKATKRVSEDFSSDSVSKSSDDDRPPQKRAKTE